MSEKKWRRKKHPSGKLSTYVDERSMPGKDSLPKGLMPIPSTIQAEKVVPIEEKYTFGQMVVDELGEMQDGWKKERQAKECAILLQRLEDGNMIQRSEAKVRMLSKYPEIYKKYKEFRPEKDIKIAEEDPVYR